MTEEEWLDIFADNLESIMNERGYTQSRLARVLRISQSSVSAYLNRRKMPSAKVLVNMALEFDEDFSDFVNFGDFID